jgi:DnaK suppressor protein
VTTTPTGAHTTITLGHTGDMSDDVREALIAKQRDIDARAADLTAAPDPTGGISFGKRVGDSTSIAVERITQVAAHEQLLVQSEEIARALAKLDEGTYGMCDSCGSQIPPGRLEIHPWAVLCVPCAGSTSR